MPNDAKNRRRKYFINKRFQRGFMIKFCLLVIMAAIISGICVYMMSASTTTTSFENSRLRIKSTGDYILPTVFLSTVIVIVVVGLATALTALFTSHKIAGPLYRMEKDVQEVAKGNLKQVFRLRKKDELKALAGALNEMTQSLNSHVSAVKNKVSELESSLEKGAGLPGEAKQRLTDLKKTLAKLDT